MQSAERDRMQREQEREGNLVLTLPCPGIRDGIWGKGVVIHWSQVDIEWSKI